MKRYLAELHFYKLIKPTKMNYEKLISLNPYIYCSFINSIGQEIKLAEHPTQGDDSPIIAICDTLQLADKTGFYDTADLIAEHKEYEPKFVDGKLRIGDMSN
jgi:hypothetical protein